MEIDPYGTQSEADLQIAELVHRRLIPSTARRAEGICLSVFSSNETLPDFLLPFWKPLN